MISNVMALNVTSNVMALVLLVPRKRTIRNTQLRSISVSTRFRLQMKGPHIYKTDKTDGQTDRRTDRHEDVHDDHD